MLTPIIFFQTLFSSHLHFLTSIIFISTYFLFCSNFEIATVAIKHEQVDMYDDLRDRCKNEDWFRSQIESPQNEKYTKDLGQKGIDLFGKNKPFKESGFYFKNYRSINELSNSNKKNCSISWRFYIINLITLYATNRVYLFIELYKKKYWPFGFWMCIELQQSLKIVTNFSSIHFCFLRHNNLVILNAMYEDKTQKHYFTFILWLSLYHSM